MDGNRAHQKRAIGRTRPLGRSGRAGVPLVAAAAAALGMIAATAALPPSSPQAAALSAQTMSVAPVAGGGRYFAEIRRTEYGIPHILAHNYGSLGYGYGYAFAQDDLCVMADRVISLRGERSKYFGPTAMSDDALGPATTNLASDIYYQGIRKSGVVQRLLALPPPLGPTTQARQLVDGYVAGYNRYLHDTGVAHLPDPTCRGKAWVTPITPLDVWSVIYDIDTLQGSVVYRTAIASATPPSATSSSAGPATAAPTRSRPPVPTMASIPANGIGSNGWALGRAATRDHDGMLLANPHLPWIGDARLYELQLTIPGVLNVSGASLYGTPVIEIGHTEHLAWTATASHAQHYTLYRLTLVPGDPTSYLVNGQAEPMTTQTVSVTVRSADGKLSTVTKTVYGSRYGPVLATGWTTKNAFAIRDAGAGNLRSVNEWLAMDRSQNLAQLRAAQDTYQGLPWMYTLATDTNGTVYFTDSSVVPHVTYAEAKRCQVDKNLGHSADGNVIILNGATTACGWGSDKDAAEPGIFGPRHDPKLTRTDYVANSNNSPRLVNPKAPITGYPPVFDHRKELELRPRLSLNMIAQRLAGTDGLGPPGFTLPTLQETMLGQRNYSADLARAAVVKMCRAHPVLTATDGKKINVRAACRVLAAWNGRANLGSRGEVLWRLSYGDLDYVTNSWWRVPFSPAHPLTTPRELNTSRPAVQSALADAVQFFGAQHVPVGIALGRTQQYAGVPLGGCTEGEGCFDRVEGIPAPGGNGVDVNVDIGSTFIMATELTPQGPCTRTILTYSESANPDSPHYTDQTVLFSRKQWVTERFTQAQINADPQLQVTILRG
jgi:acyl-homoserine-lactone acylase